MGATLDVQQLILADRPQEWRELPQALAEALRAGGGTVWHHRDCTGVLRGPHDLVYRCVDGCPVKQMQSVLANRWFLIRNDSVPGYYPHCGLCGAVHRYLTRGCVEKPFNGLTEVMAKIRQPRVDGADTITEGFRLGALEPITAIKAWELKERIRAKGYNIQ